MARRMTAQEAADELGVSSARIRQMVLKGQLPAERFGKSLVILDTDLERLRDRKPGRPAKKKKKGKK